jgi:adenylate cyclase
MSEQRRLAAIFVADVVGYSKLIGRDEAGTLAKLQSLRQQIIEPALNKHSGRLFKAMGDGFLVEFASAVQAVRAAQEIQHANAGAPLALRIGIHVGDVVVQGDDLMGDGVNVAARVEGLADIGGIAITGAVHEQVRDKLDLVFGEKGEVELKNIARAVLVFAVGGTRTTTKTTVLALPDKPSIAVLPFQNMSGDPEQEYFTDGITEDIITELARFKSLFVIARNSSFTYKGRAVDIKQVGRELGVRYVLEGSVRKSANRIRVTGQLIDTLSGSHIWADRYDRELQDVFAAQEELTESIVRAIVPYVSDAELTRVRRRRPDSLGGYEIAVRASAKVFDAVVKSDPVLCNEAIAGARAALAIDPDSTIALNTLALGAVQHLMRGTAADRPAAWREGMAAVTRAIELDRSDGLSYSIKGFLLVVAPDGPRMDEALDSARRSHELNPHDSRALIGQAYVETLAGNPERATEHLLHALRISPRDPMRPNLLQQLALASFSARRYADGVDYALRGLSEAPRLPPLHVFLASNYVGLGEIDKAKAAMAQAQRLGPAFVERHLSGNIYGATRSRQYLFARIAAGLEDPAAAEALR